MLASSSRNANRAITHTDFSLPEALTIRFVCTTNMHVLNMSFFDHNTSTCRSMNTVYHLLLNCTRSTPPQITLNISSKKPPAYGQSICSTPYHSSSSVIARPSRPTVAESVSTRLNFPVVSGTSHRTDVTMLGVQFVRMLLSQRSA